MSKGFHTVRDGPIPGLRLPRNAWAALERAGITTLDQLTAVVDRIEHVAALIGPETAHAIKAKVARVGRSTEPQS
ncbi:hypothetical protein [Microvirga aerophila]|uniref:RNA polymerase alpha subunit C-terminal domain-containing protein n=1 Tax=Microvirga aerophila TaxID=670291 RepID=A0A512BTN2_9HYPH|nr:hypothetical protein [Microvirga aerophila]GEO15343.1 hypothetical protein MAE02_30390 [Microvirga aerophila]